MAEEAGDQAPQHTVAVGIGAVHRVVERRDEGIGRSGGLEGPEGVGDGGDVGVALGTVDECAEPSADAVEVVGRGDLVGGPLRRGRALARGGAFVVARDVAAWACGPHGLVECGQRGPPIRERGPDRSPRRGHGVVVVLQRGTIAQRQRSTADDGSDDEEDEDATDRDEHCSPPYGRPRAPRRVRVSHRVGTLRRMVLRRLRRVGAAVPQRPQRLRWRMGVATGALLVGTACTSSPHPATRFDAVVTRTVDGDTVKVRYSDGRTDTVRFIGVDTPETHKRGTPVQCYGPEAERFTRAQLAGRRVTLELDREPRDKYGRLLAYVLVGGAPFQLTLLQQGYGRLLVIAPNDARARTFAAAQLSARRSGRGLWAVC